MARLLFFGKLGDLAGGRERDMPLPEDITTISALVVKLAKDDAELAAALNDPSTRYIVNEKMQPVNCVIDDADEIAFLPPVSGG